MSLSSSGELFRGTSTSRGTWSFTDDVRMLNGSPENILRFKTEICGSCRALKAYLVGHLPEIIGFLATLCTISSFLPQAIKIRKERNADSVSLKMYVITVTGFSLWTAYGVLMESLPLIFANAASLSIAVWIFVLKLRYSHDKPTSAQANTA